VHSDQDLRLLAPTAAAFAHLKALDMSDTDVDVEALHSLCTAFQQSSNRIGRLVLDRCFVRLKSADVAQVVFGM
jgi:hypothetical protein